MKKNLFFTLSLTLFIATGYAAEGGVLPTVDEALLAALRMDKGPALPGWLMYAIQPPLQNRTVRQAPKPSDFETKVAPK